MALSNNPTLGERTYESTKGFVKSAALLAIATGVAVSIFGAVFPGQEAGILGSHDMNPSI